MEKINKKYIDELEIKFVGKLDWLKLKELLILKLIECNDEKSFVKLLKALLGSMFTNIDAINDARKQLGINQLTEKEKLDFNEKEVKNGR